MNQIDLKICSFVCLMFFCLQLDRGNITQALSDNMLSDLGMSTNQYNTGQTIFYLSFLCAELPSQMLSKKLGPDVCTLYTRANFLSFNIQILTARRQGSLSKWFSGR